MTDQSSSEADVKVTSTKEGIKISATPTKAGEPKSGVNVFVRPDFIHEPIEGFVGFVKEYAVVGLAIGFAVGSQAQEIVKQVLKTFIDPAFQLFFGKALSSRTFTLHFSNHVGVFGWGALTYSLLNFIFVLAAIYAIVKFFKLDKLKNSDKKKKKA